MNRSTFILGFTLLVIAATLAASITMRNASGDNSKTNRSDTGPSRAAHSRAISAHTRTTGTSVDAKSPAPRSQAAHKVHALRVTLPEPWLAEMPAKQQAEWRTRTVAVEQTARKKLDRLTTDLKLNAAQAEKIFPLIVRSTPGYDPVMFIAGNLASQTGVAAAGKIQQVIAPQQQAPVDVAPTGSTPVAVDVQTSPILSPQQQTPVGVDLTEDDLLAVAEEIHQLLDPQQQVLVEDQEVNRQLWWQDTLARLEADLIDSTGGVTATVTTVPAEEPTTPAVTPPATEERVAPDAREDNNLFDLLDSNR